MLDYLQRARPDRRQYHHVRNRAERAPGPGEREGLFLIIGGLTSLLGGVFYFLMPANPQEAWFLRPDERIAADARLSEEHDGGDKTNFSMAQLKESWVDFNVWAAFLFGVLVTAPSPVLTVGSLHSLPKGDTVYD